jgi:aspartyl protease family protein
MNELPHTLKIVTVWLLLGLGLFLGVQAWQDHQQRSRFMVADGVVELRRGPDGHYYWPGRLEGLAVRFLVDTGATTTSIPQRLAERAGLRADGPIQTHTAGGVVMGHTARADLSLEGGVQAQRLRVAVLPDLHEPLLGMDVLGRLKLSQHQGVLTIELAPR